LKSNRFFTYKFKSSRLKEFKYDVTLNFNDALEYGEVIALFDNQMLRSIRKIKDRELDEELLRQLQTDKDTLKKEFNDNKDKIEEINNKINEMLFVPEYITIVMEHNSHYDYLYKNKLKLNNKTFVRFSSSAGQARVSTVVFIEEETAKELQVIMDNGRDLSKKLVPSKYNAYKGLAGSATQIVSTPRFCVVKDYESPSTYDVNFVIETEDDEDDKIEVREETESFNRFDGQGLISYEQSEKWAKELGLDYVPAQWCVRQNFIKGMLNTFDIHRFCEEKNGENYEVETIYTDSNGKQKIVDLRNVDVILTESQFKLWDSWGSIEAYQENCVKNDLYWGVSLYSPKKDKDILRMNYQFLQTLDLNKKDIQQICSKFVDWINGVNSGNIYYTLLFLLGTEANEEKIRNVLNYGENNWLKSLIVNPELIKDKYIKRKVYDLIKRKIKDGCMGKILLDGNFQTLVSDPYAMMQYVCGFEEITGLLGKDEHYSAYWNNKGIKTVDAMRAPLTYRSEHVLLNLQKNDDTEDWYKYSYTGVIINIHGVETVRFAGSDFDFDIVATTSDETVIKGVYKDELPIAYKAPKPQKINFTDENLFEADKFSFGSIIGSITNKSTSAFALLSQLKEGTKEYETTLNRIKMCTKLQSAQIDKAKIGKKVKGIPSSWVNYQKIKDDDSEKDKELKNFSNSIMIDRHPYFFTYLYGGTRNKYNKHFKSYDITCQQRFGKTLNELRSAKRKTKEEHEFLTLYEKYSPVIDSDCVMNNICRYVESVNFKIKHILKEESDDSIYMNYLWDVDRSFDDTKIATLTQIYNRYRKVTNQLASEMKRNKSKFDEELYNEINGQYEKFKSDALEVASNEKELVDYLVYIFYKLNPSYNKDLLWNTYGKTIHQNVKCKINNYIIPVEAEDDVCDLYYLNKKYKLQKVEC